MIEVTANNKTFRLDDKLKIKLDLMKRRYESNWDNVLLIDGLEGVGKSEGLSFPIASYLSGRDFEVVFTPEQFNKAYDNAKHGDAIVWDEFVLAGLSAQAMSGMQIEIVKKLTTGRKKRVYLILVVPNYFMFKDYFACHRSICLIHAYSPDLLTRGTFAYFSQSRKNIMYNKNKRFKFHSLKYSNFYGKYDKPKTGQFISDDYYQKKKDEAILEIGKKTDKKDKKEEKYKGRLMLMIKHLRNKGLTWKVIGEIIAVETMTICKDYNLFWSVKGLEL